LANALAASVKEQLFTSSRIRQPVLGEREILSAENFVIYRNKMFGWDNMEIKLAETSRS
jgi:hypothetical protein